MNTLEYANIEEVEMVLLSDADLIDLQDDSLYGDNEDIYAILGETLEINSWHLQKFSLSLDKSHKEYEHEIFST